MRKRRIGFLVALGVVMMFEHELRSLLVEALRWCDSFEGLSAVELGMRNCPFVFCVGSSAEPSKVLPGASCG